MKNPFAKVPSDWRTALVLGCTVVLCVVLILVYLWDRDKRNRIEVRRLYQLAHPQRVLTAQYLADSERARSTGTDNDRPNSFFARVGRIYRTVFAKDRAAQDAHAPDNGEADENASTPPDPTSTPQAGSTIESPRSTRTGNETITGSVSTSGSIDSALARRQSTTPSVTGSRSSPTGIWPASHFLSSTDMTGPSVMGGSHASHARPHRSTARPDPTSPPWTTDVTGSSAMSRASTSFALPETTPVTPTDPVTSTGAADMNTATSASPTRLSIIVEPIEGPSDVPRSGNEPSDVARSGTKPSGVEFIRTPPGYRLAPQLKGEEPSSASSDVQKSK